MHISSSDERFIQCAVIESDKSCLTSKHGSVAVVNGKILGRGHNSSRTRSSDGFIGNSCSCHAEMASLRNMYHSCCSNRFGKHGTNIKGRYQYGQAF